MKSFFVKFLTITLFSSFALASDVQEKFWDWTLFKSNRGDQTICYLAATPVKSSTSFHNRGEAFFLVTNIENDADEISVASGFIFKDNMNVELSFGSKKFYLFPYKILAWANDKKSDIEIIKEMQKNADIVVTSMAKNGKMSVDTYSLIGFSQSYKKLKKLCK